MIKTLSTINSRFSKKEKLIVIPADGYMPYYIHLVSHTSGNKLGCSRIHQYVDNKGFTITIYSVRGHSAVQRLLVVG